MAQTSVPEADIRMSCSAFRIHSHSHNVGRTYSETACIMYSCTNHVLYLAKWSIEI